LSHILEMNRSSVWKLLFCCLVAGYCLYYAPYGLNETDGGFITGLAWQLLSGKTLYLDIVYVRPPLPVWLRALELQWLPEQYAVLGERWIFYLKVATYTLAGAALLVKGYRRWILASLGFVVSAHCYPAMAWHTVDGILFAVLAAYFLLLGRSNFHLSLAGLFLFLSLLCKQSFYPLLPIFGLVVLWGKHERRRSAIWFFGSFLAVSALFFYGLHTQGSLSGFLDLTAGSSTIGQALRHGVLDFFRIKPILALPSVLLLFPVIRWFWNGKNLRLAIFTWTVWVALLVLSFAVMVWWGQRHTAPFAQSRMMFWIAVVWLIVPFLPFTGVHFPRSRAHVPALFLLLGISWCAAVSWGYNLPILFATPWVWAGMETSRGLWQNRSPMLQKILPFAVLTGLILSFRVGHEFVYRDGRRSEMDQAMGTIFPQLRGIYSDQESAALYRDLRELAERFGPDFTVLPAFPQANFLTNTPPPLPLDWVVNRETNGDNQLIIRDLNKKKPLVFIQKSFLDKIETDPELELTRQVLREGKKVAETPHFWVLETR